MSEPGGSSIAAIGAALPPHRYPQAQITEAFGDFVLGPDRSHALLERVHASAGVAHRHLALPLEQYAELDGFTAANDAFIRVGLDLAAEATTRALDAAGLSPTDVDLLVVTSVTGVAAPSLDARLVGRLGLRPDVRRLPLFGLGCVAGAAGIARVHDLLKGEPDGVAVLVSVELCSLTVQRDDPSPANQVASGLFGDGATAVVMTGARRAAGGDPRVLASRSRLYPDTERVMGWDIGTTGFRIVLDSSVADVVREHLPADVKGFLGDHRLAVDEVSRWISHPGGPKVLDAVTESLELSDDALARSWASLAEVGNLSSSSVLRVLMAHLADPPPPGSTGVVLAMGPGFCAELVLLRWPDGDA